MRIKIIAASTVLFAHALSAAPPKPPLAPTGPWNVEFADKMCLLSRPYGKDRKTHLILKPAMLGNSLELIVTRAREPVGYAEGGKAALSIEGNPSPANTYYSAYSTPKLRMLRIWIEEDAISLASLRGSLQIDAKSEGRHSFAIPGIEKALPVLSTCLDQLRTAYKISPADLTAIVTKPEGRPAALFSTDDYPEEALRKGQVGTVGILIWIDGTGHVSTCEVVESSAAPILEKTTCDVLTKRARYTPAQDAAGRSVRAPSFIRIRWAMPSF